MSRSTKAVLLSALIFPGAGHLYLKSYIRGSVLLLATLFSLWTIISNAIDQANKILNQMQTQGMAIDLTRISQLSTQATQNSNDIGNSLALLGLLICWLIAIIDSYRIGKRLSDSTEKN